MTLDAIFFAGSIFQHIADRALYAARAAIFRKKSCVARRRRAESVIAARRDGAYIVRAEQPVKKFFRARSEKAFRRAGIQKSVDPELRHSQRAFAERIYLLAVFAERRVRIASESKRREAGTRLCRKLGGGVDHSLMSVVHAVEKSQTESQPFSVRRVVFGYPATVYIFHIIRKALS